MTSMMTRAMRTGNKVAVSLCRRSHGRIGGSAKGTRVLLLTVAGRRSGIPQTAPVSYFEQEGAYLVTGSGGGMKAEPQWMRNLRAASVAHIETADWHLDTTVHIPGPAERDGLWATIVDRAPFFADYEKKAS